MTMTPPVISTDPRGLIFISPERFADMDAWHATAAEIRRDSPVMRVEVEGWPPFWAVTKHADVFDVSRRSDVFFNTQRSAPGPDLQYDMMQAFGVDLPRTLVHLHGHEHDVHRKVTNDWFKPAVVKNLQPAIDRIADEYADLLVDLGGECDLARDIVVPFTLRVIMNIFGVPQEDERVMLELTQGLFGAGDPEYMGDVTDPVELITNNITRFENYFDALAEDRRAHPTEDLATVIANGMVEGDLMGDIERRWYYIIVATAGHDTTSYALSGGIEQLLRHPDQMQALRDDPALAANAAEESIRWTSPVRSFFRWTQQDTVIGGVPIAAGDVVLTSYPSASRDEDVFVNSMQFDITRPDADKLLSFGLGMHYCLGAQVARREVRTMLAKLLERTTSIELAGEPEWTGSHFVSGVKHLPISYQLR